MRITREVWPVMLTPFTNGGEIDFNALEALIEWYEASGVNGLFAVCQSSEMFYLSLEERVELAAFVARRAKVPVIASGHISDSRDDQLDELKRIADTGVSAVILITNRLAGENEGTAVWQKNLEWLLSKLDNKIPLGFYECPYPYKRLITNDELKLCASTGRFRFMKDTCCDIALLRERTKLLNDSPMRLYNANTATLLASLQAGAAGFSGVMANFHPELYTWLIKNYEAQPEKAGLLQSYLTMASQIEKQLYPVNAKHYLKTLNLFSSIHTRSKDFTQMSPLFEDEVRQMTMLDEWIKKQLGI